MEKKKKGSRAKRDRPVEVSEDEADTILSDSPISNVAINTATSEDEQGGGRNPEICRPFLGIEVANLFTKSTGFLEPLIHDFNISDGVVVEEV
ncbi:hypothetical protein LIER_17178 [Lithospermum erythrorhizon]|uniref:Uncharacterized protein n=1 Tax=Lithospermum erythrorhizon TaxID=34254 RepID=A0AAV3QBX1_LITER